MQANSQSLFSPSFTAISAANLLLFIAFYIILPILPIYLSRELQAGASLSGLILASYTISALLIRPFAGFISDLYKGKPLLLGTFFLFSVCFSGYLLPGNLGFLLGLRIIHGLTFSLVTSAITAYVLEIIPRKKLGTGIGIFGITAALAMALGPMLGMLILEAFSYRTAFACSLSIVFMAFCVSLLIRPIRPKKPQKTALTLRSMFLPAVKRPFFAFTGVTFLYGLLLTYLSLFTLDKGLRLNAGYVFSSLACGLICSRFFAGRLIDGGKLWQIILTGKILVTGAFFVFIFTGDAIYFLGAALCIGLGYGLLTPAYQTIFTTLVPPEQRGRANSLFFTAFDFGIGIAIVLGGIVTDYASLREAYLLGVFFLLLSLFYFLLSVKPYYQQHRVKEY